MQMLQRNEPLSKRQPNKFSRDENCPSLYRKRNSSDSFGKNISLKREEWIRIFEKILSMTEFTFDNSNHLLVYKRPKYLEKKGLNKIFLETDCSWIWLMVAVLTHEYVCIISVTIFESSLRSMMCSMGCNLCIFVWNLHQLDRALVRESVSLDI